MPRRMLRTDLDNQFNNNMSNVSGTNALGKQPFSISKNRLGGNGRTIPYNGPAEGTNVPSNWSVNTTKKHNVTATSSLHVRSFNESNAILQVHGHQPRISTVSEHQKFCDHSISTINEYNCSVKDDNKKRKVSAVCGTVDQNQKKIKDTPNVPHIDSLVETQSFLNTSSQQSELTTIQNSRNIHPNFLSNVTYQNELHSDKRHNGIHIKGGSDGTQKCGSSSELHGSLDTKSNTISSESTTMDFMHNCCCTPTIREGAQSYENTSIHANYIQPTDRITKTPSTGPVENQQTHNDSFNDHMCNNSSTPYSQDVSHLYIDIGDCDNACEYCNTTYWYSERLKGGSQSHKVKYSKCCAGGNVYLEKELEPPMYFKQLFKDKHFLDNIRAYNQMFSMTSFGAEIDDSINDGRGPYVFKISGQIHHWIGTICPTKRDDPKFMQLYIYDTQNEVANRMKPFGGKDRSGLKPEIVQSLIQILDDHNELVWIFRTAREKCNEDNVTEFKIQLYNVVGNREYQLPSSGTLGAIVIETRANSQTDYDIIIEYKDRGPQRINKLHSSYMSLQYPLLFVYGQPGFNTKMTLKRVNAKRKRNKLSMNMYYRYQLHERFNQYGLLFKVGRLFQQYVVSVYCAIEQDRLDFVRANQKKLRTECLSGICDAMSKGDHFGSQIGQKNILPSSFTGGPRYMYSHYLDALAICRVLGNPQFFITFTCNVNWPEIKRHMRRYPELTQADILDVICRVFEEKLNDFLKVLKEGHIFGRCTGVLYTIEFQKRGLPHCHTLLWIDAKDKIKAPEELDRFISAELPDSIQGGC